MALAPKKSGDDTHALLNSFIRDASFGAQVVGTHPQLPLRGHDPVHPLLALLSPGFAYVHKSLHSDSDERLPASL